MLCWVMVRPKKLTMQDVTFMVEKLSPNDAAIIYNTFKFVNDLLNPEMYGHAVSAEVRDQKAGFV